MSKKTKKLSEKELQQIEDVYKNYCRTGSVCWIALDHFIACDLKEFVEQETAGLLYDLGLLPENSYILAKAGELSFDEFVERIACSEVIRHLSEELKKARNEIEGLKNKIE